MKREHLWLPVAGLRECFVWGSERPLGFHVPSQSANSCYCLNALLCPFCPVAHPEHKCGCLGIGQEELLGALQSYSTYVVWAEITGREILKDYESAEEI